MEIKIKINDSIRAFHFTDVLLTNCLSFRVLCEFEKVECDEGSYLDKEYTIFVTVPIDDKEVPF